jgi:hypothetical protein
MDVICLEDEAFYALIEAVVKRIREDDKSKAEKWIDDVEAMRRLKITSKTTLQKLRDENLIRFSQPAKRIIVYDSASIEAYLESHARGGHGEFTHKKRSR